ncbi:MAG: large conductance mechanosensitive channel protein MscL [Lachnospiraceae bacterium]|nr:large conductance mechanosensitive channel protein MscL [Lachnospiraceae bacterium]
MKKFFAEFKKFIARGNVIDMAVGIIIGGAFTSIVSSLVKDIIMPAVSILTGNQDFTNWFYAVDGKTYATIEEATEAGVATINYGVFISYIIDFLIIALVVFIFVSLVNKARKKDEAPKPKTTKVCPFCKSEVHIEATKCPHCVSELEVPAVEEK